MCVCVVAGWLLAGLPQGGAADPVPGTVQADFQLETDDTVLALAVQPDGKILIGGRFYKVNGVNRGYFARLHSDGTLDDGFNTRANADGLVRAIHLLDGGKMLVGGDFTSIGGASWAGIGRLNADGTADNTFSQAVGANGHVDAIAVQSDGKVILGGEFTKVNNVTKNYMVRLNADGSLDTTFTACINDPVYALMLDTDGRVLAGGYWPGSGTAPKSPWRLNADGTLDSTFAPAMDDNVYAMVRLSDGSYLIAGAFSKAGGQYHAGMAHVKADGSVDHAFNPQFSGTVYSMAVQASGAIVAGGQFSSVNGATCHNIARLNPNGTVDFTFVTGAGADSTVRAVALQSDGMIVLGGSFTTFNYAGHASLARLQGDPVVTPVVPLSATIWRAVEIGWPSETNGLYQVQWASEVDTNTWHDLGAPIPGNGSTNTVFDSTRSLPRKFYRVIQVNQ